MSRGMRSNSSPFGPLTATRSAWIETSTPSGMGMGCLPIRDMACYLSFLRPAHARGRAGPSWAVDADEAGASSTGEEAAADPATDMRVIRACGGRRKDTSLDLRHDLAADARLARLVACHDAARRRNDRRAHPPEDLRHLVGTDVDPAAGARDALQLGDHGLAVLGVLQAQHDLVTGTAGLGRPHLEALDVALLGQDAGKLALEPRARDGDGLLVGARAVAHPGEEVGDGIGHGHAAIAPTSSTWSCRGRSPGAPARAGRSGRHRTCGIPRVSGRTGGTGCSCASGTSAGGWPAPSGRSWPSSSLPSRSPRPAAPAPRDAHRRRGSPP